MAAQSSQAAMNARIIAHMNKDHKHDLTLYLRHFAGLSAAAAAGPELLDLEPDRMLVRSSSGTHTVAIDPPMAASLADARPRLVEMSNTAAGALAGDGVTFVVSEYRLPRAFDWVVFFAVAFYFGCAAAVGAGCVEPGRPLWEAMQQRAGLSPEVLAGFRWLVKAIFVPVLGIHFAEIWWLDRSRLRPHGIGRGSRPWWLWMGSCFFEGFCAFSRFDALVEESAKKGR